MAIRRTINMWWCLCLLLFASAAAEVHPSLSLKRVETRPGIAQVETADIDGDGRIEIIELSVDGHCFFARKISREVIFGPAMYQANSEYQMDFVRPIEIDVRPGAELAISCKDQKGDSAWLTIIAGRNKDRVLCRTEAVRGVNLSDRGSKNNPGWDGGIGQCFAVDLNRDGTPEIVTTVGVGFDLYPRGVYVYQYPSGRLLWRFPTAANPCSIVFGDANDDGMTEIFFKTCATANGAVLGDQSDTTADVFALDYQGRQIWRTGTWDRFEYSTSNIDICDCDADKTMEIYYAVLLRSEEYDRQVHVLEKHRAMDNGFLSERTFDAGSHFQQLFVASLNGDSGKEIVLNNGPSVLDPKSLATISHGPLAQGDIVYIGELGEVTSMPDNAYVGDIGSQTARPGIIIRKKDSLYMMDSDLHRLAAYGTENGGHIGAVRYFHSPFGGDYLSIMVDVGNPDRPGNILHILRIEPAGAEAVSSWWTGGRAPWVIVLVAFLLGIPAGIVLMKVLVQKPRAHPDRHLAQYQDLLSALTTFGHGQMAGRNLTRLAFLFSNLPEAANKLNEIRPNIQTAVESYRSFTENQLDNVVASSQRARTLHPIAGELAKHAAQLKALLGDSSPSFLSDDDLLRLKAIVPKTIEAIRRNIKQAEAKIMPLFGSDTLKVIPAVLSGLSEYLRKQHVGLSTVSVIGGYRHRILFPEAEMMALLEELIVNACAAMQESNTKWISFKLEHTPDQVIFELSDTGSGLKVDDPEILFSRQYSTKGSQGGYGLYRARQQVERFGGKIRIRNNSEGPGAVVQLIFKAVPLE